MKKSLKIDLIRESVALFAIMTKYLSLENIMVKMVLNKDINVRIQIVKKLSMTFQSLQFQVAKRE